MSDTALVAGPLFGLRTWSVAGPQGAERLAGPQQPVAWPADGGMLAATCLAHPEHVAPAPGCTCGVHAWHPRRHAAKQVLGIRGRVAGVMEGHGEVEVHRDGFRVERARPFALFLGPRGNAALLRRLASAYRAELVEARGPDEVLAWCRARGLGLGADVVDELLGPDRIAAAQRSRRRQRLRFAAALGALALALLLGLELTDNPGDRPLFGRTGEIRGSP